MRPDLLTFYAFQDITTDNKDEIVSDTFKLIDAGDGLWEVDCKMITKGAENFGELWLADARHLFLSMTDSLTSSS
jgi:hypothetical protein